MLVLTDTYYPGWTASVRGADARVYATDYAFRGVRVPAGRSRVVLRYEPGPLRTATLVEGAALLAIVAIGVLGVLSSRWWRSRRTARAPVPPETAPEPT